MNPRVTVGLLAVLLALGAYVYFGPSVGSGTGPGAGPTPTTAPQLDLWKLDDSQIQKIEVQPKGGASAGVQRQPDGWTLLPSGEPGDAMRINSLTFRLAGLRATRRLDSVTNLADYGLDAPSLVATVTTADGTAQTLKVGAKAPAEAGTYTQKNTDRTVYLISNAIADDLGRLVSDPPRQPTTSPSPNAGGGPAILPLTPTP
jgi:Domain of unknown function (DUF4340)